MFLASTASHTNKTLLYIPDSNAKEFYTKIIKILYYKVYLATLDNLYAYKPSHIHHNLSLNFSRNIGGSKEAARPNKNQR